jgi:hypothetical protein
MAQNIIDREGIDSARPVLAIMGIEVNENGSLEIKEDPVM